MLTVASPLHLPSSHTQHFLRRPTRWLWLCFSIISTVAAVSGTIHLVSEKMDPLRAAVEAGDENALQECLANDPKFERIDFERMYEERKTILHIACKSKHQSASFFSKLMKAIQTYFEKKYPEDFKSRLLRFINQKARYYKTALHIAAEKAGKDIVKCLIHHGADLQKKNFKGENVLNIVCKKQQEDLALFSFFLDEIEAHFKKKDDKKKSYKEPYLDFLFSTPCNSDCPLIIAAEKGYLGIVKALIEAKDKIVRDKSVNPSPPQQTKKSQKQHQTEIHLDPLHDKFMWRALRAGLRNEHLQIVQYFIEECGFPIDGDKRIDQWGTPLVEAIKTQYVEGVEYLLQEGEFKKETNEEEEKEEEANEEKAKKKACQQKADVNHSFDRMSKPLFYAATERSFKIFDLLLGQGAPIEKGYLFSAISNKGSKDIIKTLIESGVDDIEKEDLKGKTILHKVMYRRKDPEILALLLTKLEAHFKANYEDDAYEEAYKAFLNKEDYKNWAAIHIATSISYAEGVRLLVQKGVEFDKKAVKQCFSGEDELRETAFDMALHYNNAEIIKLLYTKNATFKPYILQECLVHGREASIKYIFESFKPPVNKNYDTEKRLSGCILYELMSRNYGTTEKGKKEERDRRSRIFDFLVSKGADVDLLFEGKRLIFYLLKESNAEKIKWQIESFSKNNANLVEIGEGNSIFSIIAGRCFYIKVANEYDFLTCAYQSFIKSYHNKARDTLNTLKKISQEGKIIPMQLEDGIINLLVAMCYSPFGLEVLQQENEDGQSPLDIARQANNVFTYCFLKLLIEDKGVVPELETVSTLESTWKRR